MSTPERTLWNYGITWTDTDTLRSAIPFHYLPPISAAYIYSLSLSLSLSRSSTIARANVRESGMVIVVNFTNTKVGHVIIP